MTARDSDNRFAGGCFAAMSLLFALGALALAGWSLSQSLGTRRIAATVVAVDRHVEWGPDGDEQTIHTPVAEYEVDGERIAVAGWALVGCP